MKTLGSMTFIRTPEYAEALQRGITMAMDFCARDNMTLQVEYTKKFVTVRIVARNK